jgi:hypothetical protein
MKQWTIGCVQFIYLIFFLFVSESTMISCFRERRQAHFKRKIGATTTRNLMLAPALLLTTSESISLIYPKEMGYAKDFLHTIYKLNNNINKNTNSNDTSKTARVAGQNDEQQQQKKQPEYFYRIEDAVYDNRTWSVYFIVSNSSGGSEIIRITHLVPYFNRKFNKYNSEHRTNRQNMSSFKFLNKLNSNNSQSL